MKKESNLAPELRTLGRFLIERRSAQGYTQRQLATLARIQQPRVSAIEKGAVLPTLPQLIRLAHVLAVPLQWFLSGADAPAHELASLAIQLQSLGIVDLLVPDAVAPGAFLPTEEVLAWAVRGEQPDPRIVEAIPAVLAWNRWSPRRLREYARPRSGRVTIRLAWLGDVALTIHRTIGFPGGCPQYAGLEDFVGRLARARIDLKNDDLGRPANADELPIPSKRWKISYDAQVSTFVERAERLHHLKRSRFDSE